MKRAVARLGALFLACAGAFPISFAQATATGCAAVAPATQVIDDHCSYVATADGTYVAAVQGTWRITRKHGSADPVEVASGDGSKYGALPIQAPGDVITISITGGTGLVFGGQQE